jgi:hypothetical protein
VNLTDSQATKIEGSNFNIASDQKSPTKRGESSKAIGQQPQSAVGGKRKRGNFIEDEMVLLANMSDAVRDIVSALRGTGAAHVDLDLYLVVLEMEGFTTEALIVAYTYLLENKAIASGFMKIQSSHINVWMRTYLAKNYL